MEDNVVEFLRKRDYILEKELGQGACGKTVLLYDDILNEYFVCKKYSPYSEGLRQELFARFLGEIRLLYRVNHQHIVRVYTHYLYPEQLTGYILMEHVDGVDIEEYLGEAPEHTNEVFLQAVEGFCHLEASNILHRDIRVKNILVRDDGMVKIIDLGFGKPIQQPEDFDKSISLNWWCDLPLEFDSSVYDFRTEVYFVGKLFEKLIQDLGIDCFKYTETLRRMCHRSPESRTSSFFDVQKEIQSDRFEEIEYSEEELCHYREFSGCMARHLSKIDNGTKYADDVDRIRGDLERVYRRIQLEETAPDAALVLNCFLNGTYYYRRTGFPVNAVRGFLKLLGSSSHEKQRIVMANLHTRLDSISRYSAAMDVGDEIPF